MTKKRDKKGKGFRVFIYVFFLKGGGGQGGKEKTLRLRDTKHPVVPSRTYKELFL